MLILYVAAKYDYGSPEQGLSFEHCNFYDSLRNMGHDIVYFDFTSLMQKHGRDRMNRRLLDAARSEKADLMFTVLVSEELDKDVIRRISDLPDTVTVNWFCDDHWRFDDFSRYWAPCFNWVTTTAASALPKYERLGYRSVIKTQWACNHFMYGRRDIPPRPLLQAARRSGVSSRFRKSAERPFAEPLVTRQAGPSKEPDLRPEYDVTFVGQPHGTRRETIRAVRKAGMDVRVWGRGWEEGRVSQDRMIEVFNRSRINLNLSNASVEAPRRLGAGCKLLGAIRKFFGARRSGSRRFGPYLGSEPNHDTEQPVPEGQARYNRARPSAAPSPPCRVGREPPKEAGGPDRGSDRTWQRDQIKGRNFEVPGCGGFLLTGRAENLEAYYEIGREIVCFESTEELIEKARYYLAHEDERAAIARAGYERTMKEHTYAHRFAEIFRRAGLPGASGDAFRDGAPGRGETREIG